MVNTHSCHLLADDTTRPAVLSRRGSLCCQLPAPAGRDQGHGAQVCHPSGQGQRLCRPVCRTGGGGELSWGVPGGVRQSGSRGPASPGRGQHSVWVGPRLHNVVGGPPPGPPGPH